MPAVAKCGSCKAPVLWTKTEGKVDKPGKRMPIDANADGSPMVVSRGNLVATGHTSTEGAPIVRYVASGQGQHVSHFASCPNAGKHRKR